MIFWPRFNSDLRFATMSMSITLATILLAAFGLLSAKVYAAPTAPAAAATTPEVFQHPSTAQALSAALAPVIKPLTAASALRGEFVQRKQLHELPQPLLSSGTFLVARGAGVDWHTLKPFEADLILTPQAVIQRGADGKEQRLEASQQPGLQAVSQVFDAMFALNLGQLEQSFTLFGQSDAAHGAAIGAWTLGLVPREPTLAKVIARIVISGAEQPQHIVLFETSGDRTEIDLLKTETLSTLPDAERKRFAS